MKPSAKRVADIYSSSIQVSKYIQSKKYASPSVSKMAKEFSPEVLRAFALPIYKSSSSITKHLKTIWDAFSSMPNLWEEFKKQLGIQSSNLFSLMKELPKKIKQLFKEGEKLLQKAASSIFSKYKDFLLVYEKVVKNLPSVQSWLQSTLTDILPPKILSAMQSVSSKAKSIADWLDQILSKSSVLKTLAWPAKAFIFYKIWVNVTELSWNLPEIARGMLGLISFSDLLNSLPESGLGFLFSLLFGSLLPGGDLFLKIGWNAILPFALSIQLHWLFQKGFVSYKGGTLSIDYNALGIPKGEQPESDSSDLRL